MSAANKLRDISKARLKSASILITAEDYDGGAYMLGYALECALKAAVCKSLRISSYPSDTKKHGHFLTHNFDQLLVFSGLSDVFSLSGDIQGFQNWSDFTGMYPGEWPSMRYNKDNLDRFDEKKVKDLYENLTEKPSGVITLISKKRRW